MSGSKSPEPSSSAFDEVLIIHCWSSPRSRSTAFMYSWNSRSDCLVLDEPLYRDWLYERKDRTDIQRPYKNKLLNVSEEDEKNKLTEEETAKWGREQLDLQIRIGEAIGSDPDVKIIFCKHMAKHYTMFDFDKNIQVNRSQGIKTNVTVKHVHILLLRDPVSILSSWKAASSVHGSDMPKPDEVGTIPLLSIYSELISRDLSSNPIILDSEELANDTKHTLELLCSELNIPFTEDMLSWPAGPKDCDGAWASYWYKEVHETTGWNLTQNNDGMKKSYKSIDSSMVPLLRLVLPSYQHLKSLSFINKEKHEKFLNQDLEDPKNANVLCWIGKPRTFGGGQLYPRDIAGISPFDSAVQGGDAVWEGLRVYNGKILSLEAHLTRLFQSSRAMGFKNVHSKEEVKDAIFTTLAANGMRDNAHIRLTLTRGVKCTSSMNPNFNLYGTTLIVLAEWKPVAGGRTTYDNTRGISLITAVNRRNPPSTVDSKIHHNNLINNILPKIQANHAGAADAIMLDLEGFVSETNATNIFMVNHKGVLVTPHADSCLPGITRATVMEIAKRDCNIQVEERRVSLAEFHAAEEVFTTGTMGGLSPVTNIDGRTIGTGEVGPVTKKLQTVYKTLSERSDWTTDIPVFI